LTILIADLGLTALTALLAVVETWIIVIVALAALGLIITYILGREDHSSLIGILTKIVMGGASAVGIVALLQSFGI
jgi:hypothetical protein